MNKVAITIVGAVFLLITVASLGYMALSGDTENKLKRNLISQIDHKYVVTFANGSVSKVWHLNGKVTSEVTDGKRYYFFYDINGMYVQTPMDSTVIEQEK